MKGGCLGGVSGFSAHCVCLFELVLAGVVIVRYLARNCTYGEAVQIIALDIGVDNFRFWHGKFTRALRL